MVLSIAHRTVEEEPAELRLHRIQIIRPELTCSQMLQSIVPRIIIHRVESGIKQSKHHTIVLTDRGISARHFRRIIIICFCIKEHVRRTRLRTMDHPLPKFRWHHMRHIHAKAIHAQLLPIRDNRIHLLPCIRHSFTRADRTWIIRRTISIQEIEAVI